jgi:hypothetical protein
MDNECVRIVEFFMLAELISLYKNLHQASQFHIIFFDSSIIILLFSYL